METWGQCEGGGVCVDGRREEEKKLEILRKVERKTEEVGVVVVGGPTNSLVGTGKRVRGILEEREW